MEKKEEIFLLVFDSYNHSTSMYNKLKNKGCKVELFNTPCKLSAGCSQSLVIKEESLTLAKEIGENHRIKIKNIYRIVKVTNLNTFQLVE